MLANLFFFLVLLQETEGWSGHVAHSRRMRYYTERYCCRVIYFPGYSYSSWWTTYHVDAFYRCSRHCYRQRGVSYTVKHCATGWRHTDDYSCTIPICNPDCQNGGTCTAPDTCRCTSSHTGRYCTTVLCSHELPCYPGTCIPPNTCSCAPGFQGAQCSSMSSDQIPYVGKSTCTMSNIKRSSKRFLYQFVGDGTMKTGKDIVWTNQKDFNQIQFQFESLYNPPTNLPMRPAYVSDSGFGVVENYVVLKLTKIPRHGGSRDLRLNKRYTCPDGASNTAPITDVSNCTILDEQFSMLLEHGDWLTMSFSASSGGYRRLINLDQGGIPYLTEDFIGRTTTKEVEFRFDFNAPIHCSEHNTCRGNDVVFTILDEFTKDPIDMKWSGWTDDTSAMYQYTVEVYRLNLDPYKRLTEQDKDNSVASVFNITVNHSVIINFPSYRPIRPGMYSLLLRAADTADNSKIARRLVLYDNVSDIDVNATDESKLFASSAVSETGYMWQTSGSGASQQVTVEWKKHFVNKLHDDGGLLNEVIPFPIQFKELEDDGVLSSTKFVYPGMDDTEGRRTIDKIDNRHGIIKFEVNEVYTGDEQEPTDNWKNVFPLADSHTFNAVLGSGSKVRVWVRAHDIMGNTKSDHTEVYFDSSDPVVDKLTFERNIRNGSYQYTSRILMNAVDEDSGVHKIGIKVFIEGNEQPQHETYLPGNNKSTDCHNDTACRCVLDQCFIAEQALEMDNCWFIVDKEELHSKNAHVELTVFNQALRKTKKELTITKLFEFSGLEEYSGPMNIRVAESLPNGVRLTWDLPETASCYGRTDIYIMAYTGNEPKLYHVHREETTFDILGLAPDKEYSISMGLMFGEKRVGKVPFKFKTAEPESLLSAGGIAGIVIAVLVVCGLLVAIFVVLLRRGRLQPVQRGMRALSVRYRNTFHGGRKSNNDVASGMGDDVYIYGGMEFDQGDAWQLSRDDVTFESLLKAGHFANIYKATLNRGRKSHDSVVAKTLKGYVKSINWFPYSEGFTIEDVTLMRAKINFTGKEVGDHPNIIKFIGAVVDDENLGPFILYEYCAHGPLKDYLQGQKSNVSIELQEQLFQFGLGIAKGLEYLASKKIVHRRLAARNILLTGLFEVKIAGFGPQPQVKSGGHADEDGDGGKRERIPIKWMAPECIKSTTDATLKSDVWSYGIVLWEIFSLGETPYPNIQSRDLAGRLKKGERMQKPELCDDVWYGVMKRAWHMSPAQRPTITDIRDELEKLFISSAGDDYYYCQKN